MKTGCPIEAVAEQLLKEGVEVSAGKT